MRRRDEEHTATEYAVTDGEVIVASLARLLWSVCVRACESLLSSHQFCHHRRQRLSFLGSPNDGKAIGCCWCVRASVSALRRVPFITWALGTTHSLLITSIRVIKHSCQSWIFAWKMVRSLGHLACVTSSSLFFFGFVIIIVVAVSQALNLHDPPKYLDVDWDPRLCTQSRRKFRNQNDFAITSTNGRANHDFR